MTARRNIGILAHIDAGKTTVTEHLLHLGGAVRRPGAVDAGTTVTDWMREEQERGITISSAAASFVWRGVEVTLIDTPGHVDFTIEVDRALRVLDGAVLVVSGPDGVQAQTETVWHQAARRGLPTVGFINKLDREGFDLERVLAELRERLGATPVPLQVPRGMNEGGLALLDVLTGRRTRWPLAARESRIPVLPVDEPLEAEDELIRDEALEQIVDAIASHDDVFAEAILAGEKPSREAFVRALAAAVRERAVLPLIFGSARHGVGLGPLADLVVDVLPEPASGQAFAADGSRCTVDTAGPPALFVFKTEPRRAGVHLAFVRAFAGRIEAKSPLVRTPDGESFGLAEIALVSGQDAVACDSLEAGAVGALVFREPPLPLTGDTLGTSLLPFTLEKLRPPDAVIELTVEAADPTSHERMISALRALCDDDPSLRLGTDRETGAAVLGGMGELHLEVAIERASRASGLALKAGKPTARVRWLLPRVGEGSAEVQHPTGRARVRVEVTARPRASGSTSLVPPNVDRPDWRDALAAGVASGLGQDGVSSRQVLDVEVIITAIETHGGDVIAPVMFRDAAAWATERALMDGGLEQAEPWGTLVVTVPDAAVGRVVGDLARRRVRIRRTESRGPIQELVADAPLAELIGYATALRNMTAGRAVFTVEPTGYRAVVGRT